MRRRAGRTRSSSGRSGVRRWLFAAAMSVFPAASALADDTPPTALTLDAQSRARLIESYNRWAAGIQSLRVGGSARVGAEGEPTRQFQFSMLLSRPGNARVQGRWGTLAMIFDLSGDAEAWTLYLPQERTVVKSSADAGGAGLLLPPREILAVLLPTGIPPRDVDRGGTASMDSGLARLVVPAGKGGAGSAFHRVLWLDPDEGTPRRLEVRRESQLDTPILIAVYEHFEGRGADSLPGEIAVEMPETAQWARFRLETTRVNAEVDADAFRIHIPAGTRETKPEDLTPDFLPEAEPSR